MFEKNCIQSVGSEMSISPMMEECKKFTYGRHTQTSQNPKSYVLFNV